MLFEEFERFESFEEFEGAGIDVILSLI